MQKLLLLAGALFSALPAYCANNKITSLPFFITDPGTYVLTGDMNSSASGTNPAAINISPSVSGPVVVDLKGYTIKGSAGFGLCVNIGIGFPARANAFPITIRNGTISNFSFGVWAVSSQGVSAFLSDLTVSNLTISLSQNAADSSAGIIWSYVNNSTISNCRISGGDWAIEDAQSQGGNTYSNVTAFGNDGFWILPVNSTPLTINHASVAAPAASPAP